MSIKLKVETPVIKVEAKTGLDVIQYGTLVIGDTTTLPAGSSATVVNVGTEAKAVLNFGVPKGDKGDTGDVASDAKNTFTALNAFRANIAVSNGTKAGSSGSISLGISPADEPVQTRISTDNLGGLFYHVSTNQPHVFRVGTNNDALSIRDDISKITLISNNKAFATVTHEGVAKWLGNANTATKLETARTINGVAFDGTKDIIVGSNPVGTIIAVAYTGVPEGYMHCNGAAVNRTTYVNLFNKIGTTYGAGDGSTTFNLPNTVASTTVQPPAMTVIYCIKY